MSVNTLVPVIDLPFLASEVNDAHKQVTFHAKSMLLEAKRAGEALLEAKKQVKHGEFKAWVEANCRCSYPTAREYMRVASHSKLMELHQFDGGIRAFLDAHATPRKTQPAATAPEVMAREDAEYLLKLHAMATRGSSNEQVIAWAKAETFAQQFALSPEAAIAQAQALLPDNEKSQRQREMEQASEKLKEAEARLAEVEARLAQVLTRKAEIRTQLSVHTREELLEMLVDAYLQLEP
ncbi:MAG: hypothetical protein DI528_17955 [Shinella sp.]|nr:MAG: hypothetical protein DI528_17955 [Shinella sp.]